MSVTPPRPRVPVAAPALPSEADGLLSATAGGDCGAFARFYDLFAARVQGLVVRVLRDAGQAEEVTQEIFLEVWVQAARFDPLRGSAQAWLFTMAHRRAVDRVRSAQAARDREMRSAVASLERPFDSVAETVERNGEHRALRDSLSSLSAIQRESIELAFYGGHTYREVAQIMATPLPTVKTRMRDSLIKLRASLPAA